MRESGLARISSSVPERGDRSPRFAGLRAEVDDLVGELDGQGIVLDEKKRIAECAELF